MVDRSIMIPAEYRIPKTEYRMARESKPENIIWASWRVEEDGRVEVSATFKTAEGEYRQWPASYASLEEAAAELGPGFGDVVARAVEAGSTHGRWRP